MPYVAKVSVSSGASKHKMRFLSFLERFLLHDVLSDPTLMVKTFPGPRNSPWSTALIAACGVILFGWLAAPRSLSQAPGTMTNNVALNGMLAKLKAQQDQMAANQTKIEAQTAQLQEELRQARIYSARSGSGHR